MKYLPYIIYAARIALRGAVVVYLLWSLWDIATTPPYVAPDDAVNPFLEKLDRELLEANNAVQQQRRNRSATYKWPND